MKSRSRKKGFTLVELLVVISIIALLLAIIIPSMNKARETAKRVICSNQLKEIARALSLYADSYNNKMPFYGGKDPTFDNPYKCTENFDEAASCPVDEAHPYAAFRMNEQWCQGGDLRKPYPMKLGCLYRSGIITDARLYYCPSNRKDLQYVYDSYVHPYPPNASYEWGTLPQKYNADTQMNQWVRAGYTYYPVDSTMYRFYDGAKEAPQATARRYDRLDPHIPFLADVLWFRDQLSHSTKDTFGTNAAFKDTHVVYANDWRLFSFNKDADPLQLWYLWDNRKIKFNYFYYNFFKKIQP
jgi:prepilin-type N-terminal cleavage/methylation domain-containing protein